MEQEQSSNVVEVDNEKFDQVESAPDAKKEEVAAETPVPEVTPEIDPAAIVPKEELENHDLRRMKKYMVRAYAAEAQLEALRNAPSAQAAQPVPPAREQFETDAQYVEAMVQAATAQVRQEFESKLENIKGQEARKAFALQAEAVRKEVADYDEVIEESTVKFQPGTQDIIFASPYSARLAYEIVKDDNFAMKIAAMPLHLAAKEIGKLEAKLEAELERKAAPKVAPVSKAPAPIKPVAAKAEAIGKSPSQMSDAEWLANRRKQKYKL